MSIKVIHVGLGGWGGDWARSVIPPVAEVEVAAVVDPHEPTLQAVREQLQLSPRQAFRSLTDALKKVPADAVVVTAPAAVHVPLVLEALEAGKHVLVEKPFANTVAEAAKAVSRAEELGLVLQVSQNYRSYPAPQTVRRLISQQAVGELSSISIDFRQWGNSAPSAMHRHYSFPHPMINDMGIHHFDLLRMITGREASRVFAMTGDPSFSKFREEASAVITIEMDDGLVVSYRGSWLSRGAPTAWAGEWSIQGELGEISFTSRAAENASGDRVTILHPGSAGPEAVQLPAFELFDRSAQLQAFARAIASSTAPETSGRDNLGSLAIMEAAARSASSGRIEEVVFRSRS